MSDLSDLELRLRIKAEGDDALRRVASGVEAIGKAATSTNAPADKLTAIIKQQTAAGQQLNQILTNVASGIGGTYAAAVRQAAAATLQSLGATQAQTAALLKLNQAAEQVNTTMRRVRNDQEGIERSWGSAIAENAAKAEAAGRKAAANIRAEQRAAQQELNNTLRLTQSLTGALPAGLAYSGGRLANFLTSPAGITTASVATLALGAAEMVKLANATGQYAREMSNLSATTGFTLEQTQLWSHAAEVTGTNISAIITQVRTMSKALSENSDEARKAKVALRELGLNSGGDFAYKAPEEQLRLLLQADARLRQTNEPLATNALSVLGGRGALALRPYEGQYDALSSKIGGINGAVLGGDEITKAREFNDQLKILGQTFDGLERVLGEKAIPTLSRWTDRLTGIIQNFETTGVNEGFSTLPGNVNGRPADRSWSYALSHPFSSDHPYFGVPGAPRPPLSLDDLYGKEMGSKDAAIESYLNSPGANGGGRAGQQIALERQLKDAEDDLAAARDKHDLDAVKASNQKVLGLKQQIDFLGKIEEIQKSTALLEDQASLRSQGRLGEIEVQRREMNRQLDEQAKNAPAGARAAIERNRSLREGAFSQERKDEITRQLGLDSNVDLDIQLNTLRQQFTHADRLAELALPAGADKKQLLGASEGAYQARLRQASEENGLALAGATNGSIADPQEQQRAVKKANADLVAQQKAADLERDERNRQIEKDDESRRNKADEERQKIQRQGERDVILSDANRAQRLGALTTPPGADRTASVITALQSQVELLNKLARFDENSIANDKTLSNYEKETELLRVRQQLVQETNEADLSATEQLLEIDKKRTEEARNFAGELFKAITAKNGGAGAQVGNFVRGQFQKLEETMFENLLTPTLQNLSQSLHGGLGTSSIFNGTIFGNIPHLAGGGVTTGPTIAQIGEAGQEAVIPLDNLPTMFGSSGSSFTELTTAVQDLTQVLNQTVNVSAKAPGAGNWNWLLQSAGMGFLGSAAGYSIAEMRHPRAPVELPGPEQAGQEHWTPPDPNKIFGIVGGLVGFGGGVAGHFFGGGGGGGSAQGSSLGNPAVTANTTALSASTAAVQTLTTVMTGGTGDATFLSRGTGSINGLGLGDSPGSLDLDAIGNLSPGDLSTLAMGYGPGATSLDALPFLMGSPASPYSSIGSTVGLGSSLSQFAGAIGVGATGGLIPLLSQGNGAGPIVNSIGTVTLPDGSTILSGDSTGGDATSAQVAGASVGAAATAAAGILSAISSFKQGSTRGDLGGAAALTGSAGAILGPFGAPLDIASAALSITQALMGNPQQVRQNYINQQLYNQQFQAPTTINRVVNTQGANVAYNALGYPENTSFYGYSATNPGRYYYNGQYYNSPGSVNQFNIPGQQSAAAPQVTAPVPGVSMPSSVGGGATTISLTVHALDSQSIIDRSSDIGDAVYKELQKGAPVAAQIQRTILGS